MTGTTPDGLEELIMDVIINNSVVVVAAGNEGWDLDKHKVYPASLVPSRFNMKAVSDYTKQFNRGSFVYHEDGSAPNFKGGLMYGSSFSAPRYLRKMLQDACYNATIKPTEVTCRSVTRSL
jgi:hypothetical protein